MKLLLLIGLVLWMKPDSVIVDFSAEGVVKNCRIVDDVVMGGKSAGRMAINEEGKAVFYVRVSVLKTTVVFPPSAMVSRNSGCRAIIISRSASRVMVKNTSLGSVQTAPNSTPMPAQSTPMEPGKPSW